MRRRYTLDGRCTVLTTAFNLNVQGGSIEEPHYLLDGKIHLYSCMLKELEKIYKKINRLL